MFNSDTEKRKFTPIPLLCERRKITPAVFNTRFNEIYLGLPQNLGDGFLVWLAEHLNIEVQKRVQYPVTPGVVSLWLAGNSAPDPQLRDVILAVAHDVVKGHKMTDREFLQLVRYCKGVLDTHFARKSSEVVLWANDYFFHRLFLESPVELQAIYSWFDEENRPLEFVPQHCLRMMIIRVAAATVTEAIARDEYREYQNYELAGPAAATLDAGVFNCS